MADDGGDAHPPPPGDEDLFHDAGPGPQQVAGQPWQQQQFGFNSAAQPFMWLPFPGAWPP